MVPEEFSLNDLPPEIQYQYARHLPIESIGRLSQVNRRYNDIMNSEYLWSSLYERDLPNKDTFSNNWKDTYRQRRLLLTFENFMEENMNMLTTWNYL